MLTLGSLFDGIGGWLLAAQHAEIKSLWRCEIDEYPRAVSEYHFPDVDSYGDIRKVHGNEIAPVDIICAGSPCQNLSVAGNRKGLQGNESSLFYESIRILREMRDATNGKYPRFFVWENVVGAFSSNHGNDFQAVLAEIGQADVPMPESGRWATCGMVRVPLCDIAWRTLDAQFWGVPQRRSRIFLVADFAAEGRCAAEILFVEQGVSGNLEEGSKTWQRAAGSSENCSGKSGLCLNDQGGSRMEVSKGVTGTLRAQQHSHQPAVLQSAGFCTEHSAKAEISDEEQNSSDGAGADTQGTGERQLVYATQSYSTFKSANEAATLKAQGGVNGGGSENYVAYSFDSLASNSMKSKNPYSGCRQVDISKTLDTTRPDPSKNQGGIAIFDMTHADEVMRPMRNNKANTLNSRMGTGGNQVPVLQDKEIRRIRRLTPTECERLQGLPDGYTDIEFKGKPASDARRYKAIGNGMAQPCADFVLKQIVKFQSVR